jgi:subtilisin family serine protease
MMSLALVFSVFASTSAASASPRDNQPTKRDRDLIAQARAEGKDTVKVLIAAEANQNSAVINEIQSLGGSVQVSNDNIDYVLATLPIDKAESAFAVDGVESVGLDEVLPLEDPRPEGMVDPAPQPAPNASTPQNNPYMPIVDTGAVQFMANHPTWDGRGTTVAILDTGIDLSHPALTTTTTGERKISDWVTFTSPTADGDPTWLRMNNAVSGSTFTFQSVTYTAPASGSYRIALFNERSAAMGGEIGNDVNRDGNPAGSKGIFAVLWDKASNNVYVDVNQNNSFADEQAMTDYKVRYDIGTFGTDNPATEIREALPFVVQTDSANDWVNIGIVSGAHGSHVAGIVAANKMFGGAMTGAAPGAKLVSIRVCVFAGGCTASALVNGMIFAVETAKVDTLNMSIGGLPALNAGENNGPANTRAILYNRLIDQGVQMFISAGNNGAGVNTIGDPSVAGKVVSVGSYITDKTWLSNYGSVSAYADNIHNYSSRGPREDGGFKPQIVAPGAAISTVPTWQAGQPVAGVHTLPAGYGMFNGTSMASPQAAGAAALLLSAAKQSNVQHSPAQLRTALITSARLLDLSRFEVYDQGNGLINVEGAWKLLRKNLKTVEITASVSVNTLLSGQLKTPGYGIGIYDREGVAANTTYVRRYTFTRTTGDAKPQLYHVKWVGDTDAFSAVNNIKLPLNQPVTLDVTIKTGGPGSYSAILNLEDSSTKGIDFQTMNTVIVANQFTAANNYTATTTGTVGRNQTLHFFYNIPAGTPAFKVDLTGTTGQVRFIRFSPYGLPAEDAVVSTSLCYVPVVPGNTCNGASRTVANPMAGVWELTVDARRTSDAAVSTFTLTASILGAKVSPNPDTIATAQLNTPVNRSYTFTNLYGTFNGAATGSNLGSARKSRPTINDLATQTYTVFVEPGSTSLTARIGNTSDGSADLDLFVRNASGATVGQSADGDSEEMVTINLPANFAGGTYTIAVQGYAVPTGTTAYDYLDIFANTKFGTVALTDAAATHPAGSSWTVPGVVTAKAAPAAGRTLLGTVQVIFEGISIGSGQVEVLSVTP